MKQEELIKRLENVKPLTIKLEGHRRRLKMALLASGYPKERRVLGGLTKGAREIMLKVLKSPQPLWKPLVFGAMALALVIGLTWATLSSDEHPQVVMAGDTLMLVPESSEAYSSNEYFEGYDLIVFTIDGEVVAAVSKVGSIEKALLEFTSGSGGNRTLTVNLEARELTLAEINRLRLGNLELSESDEQKAIDIARADTEVNELLTQGASIGKVIEEYIPYNGRIDSETVFDASIATIPKNGAIVLLEQGDEHWIVHIDLAEEIVKSLTKPSG